jgi:uncharacterized membrane protein YecN with MAPEG domain
MPFVTMLYAGILGLLSIGVAFPAGQLRGKLGIPLGDGGNTALLHAMRRQANFIEVVPMALILIGLLEMSGVSRYAIHGLGAALVFFRLCHAFGFKADSMTGAGRVIGAAGSALLTVAVSVWAIIRFAF